MSGYGKIRAMKTNPNGISNSPWQIGCYVLIIITMFCLMDKWSQSTRRKSETRERIAKEEMIEKQFDADFAFVCERIAQRDLEIYSFAEKFDRELLVEVERLSSQTNGANDYRAQLESRLKRRLNHHIQDCIRMRSRITESRSAAHRFDADIYMTKCDCECCMRN